MPAEGGESGIDRKALWVVRELGLPAIVTTCVSCRSTRHHPSGKFRVNANGKLLDVWMLIRCESCGRTSKIPVHERIHVQALECERPLMFETNDPTMVRHLAMGATLAGKAAYQLDRNGTYELETDMPFYEIGSADSAPLEVVIRFELPAPTRVKKLLTAGSDRSRSAVKDIVDSRRIHLPIAIDTKVREDFTLSVTTLSTSTETGSSRRSTTIGDAIPRWACSTPPSTKTDHPYWQPPHSNRCPHPRANARRTRFPRTGRTPYPATTCEPPENDHTPRPTPTSTSLSWASAQARRLVRICPP